MAAGTRLCDRVFPLIPGPRAALGLLLRVYSAPSIRPIQPDPVWLDQGPVAIDRAHGRHWPASARNRLLAAARDGPSLVVVGGGRLCRVCCAHFWPGAGGHYAVVQQICALGARVCRPD